MKSRIFLAVLAGVALTGCVKDNEYGVEQRSEKVKIAFESPVMYNTGTRANYHGEIGAHIYTGNTTTYSYPREEEFRIFAVQHGGDFAGWASASKAEFNGQAIARDPSLDGWAPKNGEKYYNWPDGKMSFAACSPADMEQADDSWETNNIAYGATGLTLTDFKVPTDVSKHIDVLFSRRTVNQTKANMNQDASNYSGIPIQFQHALSSIHFSLMNDSGDNVVLKSIIINGIHDTGTFKENITENSSDYTQYVIKDGTNGGNVDPSWTVNTSNTVSYTAFSTQDGEGVVFPVEPQYVGSLLGDTSANNTGTNHVLLVMPQEIPTSATLTVQYTVNGTAGVKEVNLHNAVDLSTNSLTEWKMGTRYTYRLHYSKVSASQDRIYFAPSTDGWKPAATAVIELK